MKKLNKLLLTEFYLVSRFIIFILFLFFFIITYHIFYKNCNNTSKLFKSKSIPLACANSCKFLNCS